jgi:hypothetical protein
MEILQGNLDKSKQNFRMKINVLFYLCKELKEINKAQDESSIQQSDTSN